MSLKGDRIIVVGDMHGRWNFADNVYLDRSRPDLVLFVGDLGSGTLKNELSVIKQLARLSVRGLVLPGNNDAAFLAELKAELSHQAGVLDLMRVLGKTSRQGLESAGFSLHELSTAQGGVSLICARPCSMGGTGLAFSDQLKRNWDVGSLQESATRLCALVDQATSRDLMFMAHNGPFGLGDTPDSMFGRDFSFPDARQSSEPLDWGDSDLQSAISYAKSRGKRVLGVLAGHMHRRPHSRKRPFVQEHDETMYVNAAVVPRIMSATEQATLRQQESGQATDPSPRPLEGGASHEYHHFVELELRPAMAEPHERFVVREKWVALE